VPGWWTVDERSPEVHRGEREREAGDLPHELAEQGAAYAGVGDREARSRRAPKNEEEEQGSDEQEDDDASGEGEPGSDEPAEEGGAD
jgi:hypothetical protein